MYAKQANLRKAAEANGSVITSYFQSRAEDPIAKYNAMRTAVDSRASVSVVLTALAEILQAEPVPYRPSEPLLQLKTPDNRAMEPECNEQVQNSTLINHTQCCPRRCI